MNDTDEIAAITPLSRVRHGADPASEGARSLLADITAHTPEPGPAPRRGRRPARLLLGLAATAVLGSAAVLGPSLLSDDASYAVTKTPDGKVVIEVTDFRDAAGLERRLKELNVPAIVDFVPMGQTCRENRGKFVAYEDIPKGLYAMPGWVPELPNDGTPGLRMLIDTTLFKPGQTFVWTISPSTAGDGSSTTILMEGPIGPCEPIPVPEVTPPKQEYRLATSKGGSLHGLRVDEKSVGEVLPELRKRGKKVVFLLMIVAPDNPGGYGVGRTQRTPVPDHWTVWEAEENDKGVIRLMVTEKRFDRNPVYAGPRDNVIKE
ncbi:hypothetical protein [Nonomuraea longicatena]|uniref:Uncharacterized protein n=1 Tax=Nonomuraea longicatena TaxID=83682 RepID=A0ABP4BLK8_9ACTN